MFYICYGFKKFRKSGKCRVRIKIRIRNSGKKNFQIFFLFNSEQFLLNGYFSKMVISPKKVGFLLISCTPASSRKQKDWCSSNWYQNDHNGAEFDPPQVPAIFFPEKKPDPEIQEKFRMPNFKIFWLDFNNGLQKKLLYGAILNSLCNFL